MATLASVMYDPHVRQILDSDTALISDLEGKVEALREDAQKAHLKASHRRMAIKGLERRAEHLEHLLAAARGDTERLDKVEFAARTLLRMCGGDAFAALDALLEHAFGGRVDELCDHIADLDTANCEWGCGEWITEAIHYDNEGVPLCRSCWASLTGEDGGG